MTNDKKFEIDWEVIELLPAGFIKVILSEDYWSVEVRCKRSGKMSKNRVSVIPGDRVKVEISPYDMTQGRITYRYNGKPAPESNDSKDVLDSI